MAFAVTGDPTACRRAIARGSTNSSGLFDLPSSSADTWVVIFPPIERFANPYWICAGSSDSSLRAVYEGRTPVGSRTTADTVNCLEWLWQGEKRVTCAPRANEKRNMISGGTWHEGDASGSYRLIMPRERGIPRLLVQWLDSSHVRAIAALPLDPRTEGLDDVRLEERGAGRWCVTVVGRLPVQAFELGPPGIVNKAKLPYCAAG